MNKKKFYRIGYKSIFFLTFHLQSFSSPNDLRFRVTPDFSFKEGIAALSEPRVPEDLLEDGRGGALHQRHFEMECTP
jgi:hypothetical protein